MTPRQTRADQVRAALLSQLRAARYVSGDKLPNEDRLADEFDVSRATVREAVRGLVEAGYLNRKHGSGTFVTGLPAHRHSVDTTVSYTDMIREAGMSPGEKVISRVEQPATPAESARLGVDDAAVLVCIERVRTADGTPAIYSQDRIPRDALADLADTPLDASLYQLLAQAGLTVHHATATLRPVTADARLARLLGVRRGTPLQYIDQVDCTAGGGAVMLSSEWHVPGLFDLVVNRRPASGEPGG